MFIYSMSPSYLLLRNLLLFFYERLFHPVNSLLLSVLLLYGFFYIIVSYEIFLFASKIAASFTTMRSASFYEFSTGSSSFHISIFLFASNDPLVFYQVLLFSSTIEFFFMFCFYIFTLHKFIYFIASYEFFLFASMITSSFLLYRFCFFPRALLNLNAGIFFYSMSPSYLLLIASKESASLVLFF